MGILNDLLNKIKNTDPNTRQYKRYHVACLVEIGGFSQKEIADIVGYSDSSVTRTIRDFSNGGVEALELKPHGGRDPRALLNQEEENLFIDSLPKSKDGLVDARFAKEQLETLVGRYVNMTTVRAILKRHDIVATTRMQNKPAVVCFEGKSVDAELYLSSGILKSEGDSAKTTALNVVEAIDFAMFKLARDQERGGGVIPMVIVPVKSLESRNSSNK